MLRIIATENINREKVEELAKKYFPRGFTTMEGKGFWGGVAEDSLLVLVTGEVEPAAINWFCKDVKVLNKQDCVMVIELPGEANFI